MTGKEHGHAHGMTEDMSTAGRTYHVDTLGDGPSMASGTRGNDEFFATTNGKISEQIHLYGHGGDDLFHLNLTVDGARTVQHGHHVFGGEGSDTFSFENLQHLRGTIVGRLDDFSLADDRILVNGQELDLSNPSALAGFDIRIVEYQGQQWLDMRNSEGGRAFYALEGARQEQKPDGTFADEAHFLAWNTKIPNDLPEVGYRDPVNSLPGKMTAGRTAAHDISPTLGDADQAHVIGTDASEMITTRRGDDIIDGGKGDDIIDGYMGDDTIHGGDGNDVITAGKGFDLVYGGAGDDLISGGSDSDTIYGGAGNDTIYGGSEDDLLWGDDGDDYVHGGIGKDTIHGGAGNDTLVAHGHGSSVFGGAGNDSLHLDAKDLDVSGGEGSDVYFIGRNATVTIRDFDVANDKLGISDLFEDEEDLRGFVRQEPNTADPEQTDLVIEIPDGGRIVLQRAGMIADNPGFIVDGWDIPAPEEDGSMDDALVVSPDPDLPVLPPIDDTDPGTSDDEIEDDPSDDGDDGGMGGLGLLLMLGGLVALFGGGAGAALGL